MRRSIFALAGLCAVVGIAIALGLPTRSPQPPESAPSRVQAAATPPAAPTLAPAPSPRPVAEPHAEVPRVGLPALRDPVRAESRVEVDLLQLEDRALRRIDVSELLAAAGIDESELRRRSDGQDILRHLAGDELLVREVMRDLFSDAVYPAGFPRDEALREARSSAEGRIAALSVEARAESLASAVERDDVSAPEPNFYGAESGRVYQAADAGDGSDSR
jgi:hypothetical protein